MNRLQGVKVVLVDDDLDVLEAMETAMKAEGADTRKVADGNEAVSACQEFGPDLVVLDMMLPKRSGFLVLEKIKGYQDCPSVIMLTANEGKRHQAYAESLGVDRYLLKPVPLEKLLTVAVDLVARRAESGDTDAGDRAAVDEEAGPKPVVRTTSGKKAAAASDPATGAASAATSPRARRAKKP